MVEKNVQQEVWQGIYQLGRKPVGMDFFLELLRKAGRHEFDDEYLNLAIAYRDVAPQPERFWVFYAWYALAHGNYEVALEGAEKARQIRQVNGVIWKLLVTCYTHFGRHMEAVWYQGLLHKFYDEPLALQIPEQSSYEYFQRLSIALGVSGYAPMAVRRVRLDADNKLRENKAILVGEYLPEMYVSQEPPYWVGVYVGCQGNLNNRGGVLEAIKENQDVVRHCGGDMVFDFMRARTYTDWLYEPEGAVILPIAGTEAKQCLRVDCASVQEPAWLGKWSFDFYRVEEQVHFSSDAPFVVGKPIKLGHSSTRHKLVLHIMVDALCWHHIKEQGYRLVPNILNFFQRGIIFSNNFSASEYTYPSFASIETGLYPHHHQIFNEQAAVALMPAYKTLAEQMRNMGYYSVDILDGGATVYNSVARGYDRRLATADLMSVAEAVERTIQQIEAFDECDQFLLLHTTDTHPWDIRDFQIPPAAQTHLSLADRLEGMEEKQASVRLQCTPFYMQGNDVGVRNTDRSLGMLFTYLQEHFSEDEYVVELCSDHGVSIYDEVPYNLSDNHTGAALMLRGAGVPQLGFVDDELTSTVDIYPIMAKLCDFPLPEKLDGNLPAALGGKKREYVISNTMFPGQTYQLRVRMPSCQMDLESVLPVEQDGTVDLTGARLWASRRDGRSGGVSEREMDSLLEIVKMHTQAFDMQGCQWPMLAKSGES